MIIGGNVIIGNKGINYLTKMEFPKLKLIGFSKININIGLWNIGDVGIQHLTKAKWPNLSRLFICKIYIYIK